MKGLVLSAALFVLPAAGWAQSCCVSGTSYTLSTSCPSSPFGNYYDSLTTKHTWKMVVPGTMRLGMTGYTIIFSESRNDYLLKWKDKEVVHEASLGIIQRKGVSLAADRQEMGLPLD